MNRKLRREIRKDISLVNALYNIIKKYLPKLFNLFDDLTDIRHQSYVTYDMKVICITRLFALLCGITTMNSLTDTFNSQEAINNISKLCKSNLDDIPHYDTINDVFENINIDELRYIQKYIAYTIIRSKMFDSLRYNGKIQIVVDGTSLVSFNYKHCDHCLVDSHSDGSITYKHYVLEAKIIFGSFVLSIDSEFIENPNHDVVKYKKQDCETKAFKRLASRLKKNFPKLKFIITADGLYTSSPIIKVCKDNNWDYIFRLKSEFPKTITQDFEGIIKYHNETNLENYFLVKNYSYHKHTFNIVRLVENNKTFTYITNLDINDKNISDIVLLGRNRWKIENNGFNLQKNNTFDITHMCSYNYNAMKAHYFFIQFAHTIRQLLELGHIPIQKLKYKIKEISLLLLFELISLNINLIENLSFQLRFDTLII